MTLYSNIFDTNLLDSIPIGICIVDKEYNVLFWNNAVSEWTDITGKDIQGKKLYDFFPHFKEPRYIMRLENIFEGGPPVILSSQFHRELFRTGNEKQYHRIYHIIASSFRDSSNSSSMLFTIKDITDIEQLILKYRELKNKALSEVEKRKKAEKRLIEANSTLEFLANTDQLTSLFNRRKFTDIITLEIDRVKRNTDPFSVIFIDLDDFKIFNSMHGHECGDFVLKQTALFLKNSIRKTDTVSRWGGEEFIILLPETDLEHAKKLTEKLREKIEETEFIFKKKNLKITMTLGISMFNREKDTFDSVINRADDALHKGKAEGKNRVICSY